MLIRLILKVTKFQFPSPKRLGTVVKNILGGIMAPLPCQIKLRMADGLVTLVDEVNLKGASLLVRKILGLGAEGAGVCR